MRRDAHLQATSLNRPLSACAAAWLLLLAIAEPSYSQTLTAQKADELNKALTSRCAAGSLDQGSCTMLQNCINLPALCANDVKPSAGSILAVASGMTESTGGALSAVQEGGLAAAMASSSSSYVYGYDVRKRLVRVAGSGVEVLYAYDKNGNRTAVTIPEPEMAACLAAGVVAILLVRGFQSRLRRSAATASGRARARTVAVTGLVLVASVMLGRDAHAQTIPGEYRVSFPGAEIIRGEAAGACQHFCV